jgi:hypothetical protein
MDAATRIRLYGLVALALAGLVAFGMLLLLAWYRRSRRQPTRPVWPRMLAETNYFRHAMARILLARGFTVVGWREIRDPIERQTREIIFTLQRGDQRYAALCGRWVIPITSEMIARFEKAMAATRTSGGLIVTTSYFSEAARTRAAGLPVELHDGAQLQQWIAQLWP